MTPGGWWEEVTGQDLAQGDLLLGCLIPVLAEQISPAPGAAVITGAFDGRFYDLIVLTRSCDLENDKAPLVATCPYFTVAAYEAANPELGRRGRWELARQGRIEGLHLLAAPEEPANNRLALVVDFRQVYTLPIHYLRQRAEELGLRNRLQSPYLEYLSPAFARFFMRVGLPANIPPFR